MATEIQESDGSEHVKSGKSKRSRPVTVQIVERQSKAVLVQYIDGGLYKRVTIPANKLKGNDTDVETLAQGIPHGEDWSAIFANLDNADAIANELRRANIYTVEDFRREIATVRAIVTREFVNPLVNAMLAAL